jgi:hypothetical protein
MQSIERHWDVEQLHRFIDRRTDTEYRQRPLGTANPPEGIELGSG